MISKEFQKKKDKILNKIFVSSDDVIVKLKTKINYLEDENRVLRLKKKQNVNKILNHVGEIMRFHEEEFEKRICREPTKETKDCFVDFWHKLEKELPAKLYPEKAEAKAIRKEKKKMLCAQRQGGMKEQ